MSNSSKYIEALEKLKNWRDGQSISNLVDIWMRARSNEEDFDITTIREYMYSIKNCIKV